ncbi:MAG TPA: DUF4270 family protein [Bacteroidia bacterium]|jgi:hypothetical protein|nr:DUF4270 family protein [Bacteroidia bacterium]
MLKKLIILFITGIFLVSCHKNDSPVGIDVLPDSDQLNGAYAELIPKITFSRQDDSLMTSNLTTSNLLGSVNDPVFGRFDASIFVNYEVGSGGLGSTLGTNPVIDSVVLVLEYNTAAAIPYIGDTTHPLSINIFPLTQKIHRDSTYFSRRKIAYDPNHSMIEGGQSKTFTPNLRTRILVNKDDATLNPYPQLRIRLRKDFGEMLFNTTYLNSLTNFQNAFYGFFITTNNSILPQPSYGSAFYINMLTSNILLYYHNDDVNGHYPQLLPINIGCGANSVRFGHFDHDYHFLAEPQLAQQVSGSYDTSATGPGKQNIYLQGAGGLRAKVEFPDLLNWRDSNIVINKAELSFTVDKSKSDYFNSTFPSLYPIPVKLFLEGVSPTTSGPLGLIENIYAFGGAYDPNTNRYAFNVPHTVAQILTKKTDITAFYVSVYTPAIFPHRVVLGGYNSTEAPVKLKFWYTRLKFPKRMKK